jgi:hypothetical protein
VRSSLAAQSLVRRARRVCRPQSGVCRSSRMFGWSTPGFSTGVVGRTGTVAFHDDGDCPPCSVRANAQHACVLRLPERGGAGCQSRTPTRGIPHTAIWAASISSRYSMSPAVRCTHVIMPSARPVNVLTRKALCPISPGAPAHGTVLHPRRGFAGPQSPVSVLL